MKRRGKAALCLGMTGVMAVGTMLSGCGKEQTNGKVKIEVVQYKPEAVDVFEELEKKFNETHDNIELVIDSPNDAMTILKTRFIREDYPDIIGIGSDVNYSNFLDSDYVNGIFRILTGSMILKKRILRQIKKWNMCRWTEFMQCRTWPMRPVSFTTRICLKNMAGRFQPHG